MISIALLGFGCVGSGTAEVLYENKDIIESRLGCEYRIKYILDLRDFPDSPFGDLIVHDFNTILNDDEVTIVAEMMGGEHPAYDFTKACLEAGKNVVTSNKAVVASFGVELGEIAAENGVRYMFEASVGGGIPIIRPLMTDLSANKVNQINGILNGTTNYILTSMRDDAKGFNEALSEAQRLGYAEADPTADVGGFDTARKTVILGAIATGKLMSIEDMNIQGIEDITLEDVNLANQLGYEIKLIGHCEINDGKLFSIVSPMLVPISNPLSGIDGVFNGILVNANMVGEVMFYGPGAGKLPTASAVVSDIVDIIAKKDFAAAPLNWKKAEKQDIDDFDSFSCKRFIISSKKLDGLKEAASYHNHYAYTTDELTEKQNKELLLSNSEIEKTYRII